MRRRLLPLYVTAFADRHGRERLRFRRKGFETRYLKAPFGTEEFRIEYRACLDASSAANPMIGASRIVPGTINDLISRYYRSSDWMRRPEGAQKLDRRILERFRAEHGSKTVANLRFEHIDAILASRAKTPEAANKLRKELKRLMAYALDIDMIHKDPMARTRPIKSKSSGFHTWTEAEIAQFQQRHPIGTKARLALELMLWTSQRRGDAIRMGRQHIRDGRIRVVQGKTGTGLWIAVAPQLLEAIVATPNDHLTFLVTEYGKPFTAAGFGNWFRDRCDEAGLPHCTAHGLRKAMARRLAEINQSNQSIKSVTGHKGDQEVALYTRDASQIELADRAIAALAQWEMANRNTRLATKQA